jgi:hypothetical protein
MKRFCLFVVLCSLVIVQQVTATGSLKFTDILIPHLNGERSAPQTISFTVDPLQLFAKDVKLYEPTISGDIEQTAPKHKFYSGKVDDYPDSIVSMAYMDGVYKGFVSMDEKHYWFEWSETESTRLLNEVTSLKSKVAPCVAKEPPLSSEPQLDTTAPSNITASSKAKRQVTQLNPNVIRVAIECDEETYSRFGSYTAAVDYFSFVMNIVSSIYQTEINAVLQIASVRCGPTDAYNFTETEDSEVALDQFRYCCCFLFVLNVNRENWIANHDAVPRDIALLLSNSSFGGIAYLRGACSTDIGYAVAGLEFDAPRSTWDVIVVAHVRISFFVQQIHHPLRVVSYVNFVD